MSQRTYKNKDIKTSSSDNWRTPRDFFALVQDEFHLTFDRAADDDNHLIDWYSTKGQDALSCQWLYPSWANIPYSEPGKWFKHARQSAIDWGTLSVLLVKVATSENYWVENVKDAHVRFIHSRMKFLDETNTPHYTAKFGNALVIFSPETIGNPNTSYWDYKEKAVKLF